MHSWQVRAGSRHRDKPGKWDWSDQWREERNRRTESGHTCGALYWVYCSVCSTITIRL